MFTEIFQGFVALSTNNVTFTPIPYEFPDKNTAMQPTLVPAENSAGATRISIQGIASVGSNPLASGRKLSVSKRSVPLAESNLS